MKVKSIDIAHKLGISKATVSLALNGKPGVSPETRDAVLQCRTELEQLEQKFTQTSAQAAVSSSVKQNFAAKETGAQARQLKIIMFDRNLSIICDTNLNLWPSALRIFDQEAKLHGYTIGITYARLEDTKEVIKSCNSPEVAGVLLFATEMEEADFAPFCSLQKPMVIYDHNFSPNHHCIVADNEDGTRKILYYLVEHGCKNIVYLANSYHIHNFEQRRFGFLTGVYMAKLNTEDCPIVPVGNTITEIEQSVKGWLEENPLPDAFLMENYQVSIGTLRALHAAQIRIPEQISLIGIDEVPSYLTNDIYLTHLSIDHVSRARIAIEQLIQEIEKKPSVKLTIVSRSHLVEGNSVNFHKTP